MGWLVEWVGLGGVDRRVDSPTPHPHNTHPHKYIHILKTKQTPKNSHALVPRVEPPAQEARAVGLVVVDVARRDGRALNADLPNGAGGQHLYIYCCGVGVGVG